MEHTAAQMPSPDTAAELEAALDQIIGEIREVRARMAEDDADIDRLKRETAELRAETRAIIASLPV